MAASIRTNLVAYYKMDNGAFGTDSVAGTYPLTTSGSTQQSGGFFGYCGSGDNMRSGSNFGLTGTADLSISWWVKFTSDIGSGALGLMFINSTLTTDRLIALDYEYNSGTRRLAVYNSTASATATGNATLGTTWHHIAVVRSATAVTVYLDGAALISGAAQGSTTGTQNNAYLGTGASAGGGANQYYDEWGIWTRAITAAEVAKLYNGGAGNPYPLFDVLINETATLTEALSYSRGVNIAETATLTESVSTNSPRNSWPGQSKSANTWTTQNKS